MTVDQLIAFVNTRLDRPTGTVTAFDDPVGAGAWLSDRFGQRVRPAMGDDDYRALVRLRTALHALVLARMDGSPPAVEDVDVLNRSARAAPTVSELSPSWEPRRRLVGQRTGSPGAAPVLLGLIATAAVALLTSPTGDLLAECAAHDCVVVFLRTDPRRRWHTDRCGNRVRAARSYAGRTAG